MDQQLTKEIDDLKGRVSELEDTQQHITSVIEDNSNSLKNIEHALTGDSLRGTGFISRIQTNEDDIEMLKKFKTKLVAYTAVASGLAVAVVNYLMSLL